MNEQVLRVYVDTSVFGGAFDEEFRTPSQEFFAQGRAGRFELVVSSLVEDELALAPSVVRALFEETAARDATYVDITAEADRLQEWYIQHSVLTARWGDDALHVAIATVSGCSALVSWNFRHIVHYGRIPLFNAVNVLHGYGPIAIHSPSEVIRYEEDV